MEKKSQEHLAELVAEATDERIVDLKAVIERQRKSIDRLKDKKADLIDAMN